MEKIEKIREMGTGKIENNKRNGEIEKLEKIEDVGN